MKRVLWIVLESLLLCGAAGFTAAGTRHAAPQHPGPTPAAARQSGDTGLPEGAFRRNDTLFFHETDSIDERGFRVIRRVFVETHIAAPSFQALRKRALLDAPDNRRDLEEGTLRLHEKYPRPLPHHDRGACPETWVPLVRVAGTYYIDGRNPYPVWITDSLFVEATTDGPRPRRLETFERREKGHYRFTALGLDSDTIRAYDLYLTDTLRRMAVLVERDHDRKRYRLLAAAEALPELPLLVWEMTDLSDGREVPTDSLDLQQRIDSMYPHKMEKE